MEARPSLKNIEFASKGLIEDGDDDGEGMMILEREHQESLESLRAQLTPVSEGTVQSAISEAEQIDFELDSDEVSIKRILTRQHKKTKKKGPGRPKGSSNLASQKKLIALEALFENPNMFLTSSRRSHDNILRSSYSVDNVADFHRCCQYGQLAMLETMLRKGQAEVDCRDARMNTPLHEAAIHGQLEVVKFLLLKNADISAENLVKETPLMWARNHEEITELLKDYEGFSKLKMDPLFAACWEGKKRQTWTFIRGDNFNLYFTDTFGNTALHYASIRNNVECIEILLAEPSTGSLLYTIQNSKGNTALHEACRFSCPEAVKILLESGSDFLIKNKEMKMASFYASKSIKKIFRKFARENKIKDEEFLDGISTKRFILKSDNNSNDGSEDEDGEGEDDSDLMPMKRGLSREERKLQRMLAILNRSSEDQPKRSKVDGRMRRKDDEKRKTVKKKSQIVTDEDEEEENEVELYLQSSPVPRRKIEKKPVRLDPTFVDKASGRTQLHKHAAKGNVQECLELIRLDKRLLKRKDNGGYTALHEASLKGHEVIVDILLDAGAKVDARSMEGDTALHDAAANSHYDVVKALLAGGADRERKNDEGKRPADVCKDPDCLTLLLSDDFPNADKDGREVVTRSRQRSKSVPLMINSEASTEEYSTEGEFISPVKSKKKGSPLKSNTKTKIKKIRRNTVVEIISKEPLLQVHCHPLDGGSSISIISDNNEDSGWFFLSPQIDELFVKFFGDEKLLVEVIPEGKRRHLLPEETQRLLESKVVEKLGSLRVHLQHASHPLLLDKDSVIELFEDAGGNLSNVPIIYVDLQRLSRKQNEDINSPLLPPKLKMKWQRKSFDHPSNNFPHDL